LCLCLTVKCRMIPSVQCMHTRAHTHSLTHYKKLLDTLASLVNSSLNPVCLFVAKILQSSSHIHPTLSTKLFPRTSMASSTLTLLQKNPQTQTPTHTNTTPPPSLSLSVLLVLLGIPEAKPFSHSLSSGLSTEEQNSSNQPMHEHDDVRRRTQTLTCGCLCGGVRNLCLCLCSVRPLSQTCPPHNSRSSVPPHTLLFFWSHKCLIEWGKNKLALWVHQSQENKTKRKNLKIN
jgi:hypothetical protein